MTVHVECDKCGRMQLKSGRFGKYFGCVECSNTRKLLREPAPKADPVPMPELRCEKVEDHYGGETALPAFSSRQPVSEAPGTCAAGRRNQTYANELTSNSATCWQRLSKTRTVTSGDSIHEKPRSIRTVGA